MRKIVYLLVLGLFLCGCTSANESEFWKHDTMYKNFDHMKYSWCPCDPVYSKTKDPSWWGIPTQKCVK